MRYALPLACLALLAAPAAAQPDLNGGALLFPEPDRVDPGDAFFLPFVVSNGGTEASPPFEVAIYFSTDRFVSDDDSLLVRLPFEALGAQQNAFSGATLTVPDVPRGGYRVLVSMDDPDEVAETNETNNVSYGLLTVGGDFGGPDLLIGTGSLEDGEAAPGDRISFSYEVLNQGAGDVGDFEVGYYLVPINSPPSEWFFLEREVLGGLDSGEGEDESEQATIPEGTPPGEYGFLIWADDRNLVEERDETNNSLGIRRINISEPTMALEGGPEGEVPGLSVWPNPASGTTTLSYVLSEADLVHLAVYDALGREVTVAAEGVRAAGEHAAQVDVSALAPGLYVVRLDAGGGRAVQAVTVAR